MQCAEQDLLLGIGHAFLIRNVHMIFLDTNTITQTCFIICMTELNCIWRFVNDEQDLLPLFTMSGVLYLYFSYCVTSYCYK